MERKDNDEYSRRERERGPISRDIWVRNFAWGLWRKRSQRYAVIERTPSSWRIAENFREVWGGGINQKVRERTKMKGEIKGKRKEMRTPDSKFWGEKRRWELRTWGVEFSSRGSKRTTRCDGEGSRIFRWMLIRFLFGSENVINAW